MFWLVISIVVFLALSGLMAAVDAAVLSVTRPEIEVLVEQKCWGARRLRRVKEGITRSVVVIVITTNTVNVLGPILVSRQGFLLFGDRGIVGVTIVLTIGTIIFSEIIPKAVGHHYAPFFARASSPAILAGRMLLYPLVEAFSWLSNLLTTRPRRVGTEGQIRSLVRIGRSQGHIEADEGVMIHRAFLLNDKTAGQIMTPLEDVKALGEQYSISQAASEVCRSQFSRYPVFGESVDEVSGTVLGRDVLVASIDQSAANVSSIKKPAVVVAAATKSDALLAIFRDRRIHLAVVQDLGKTVGIVTLEDVLEQLVGAIEDEKDALL
ncbi:CNNM domain-containing protein [Rhodopirellula sp. JC639]|uniref:CNNM domain-containing protein n=1 Tax=Stieleria mannarensis TaxID=2755585 RepID=UPI0015FF760C|nr:CNNM domain-containing protein [Rhodopirellula sp. JC639]